MSAYVDALKNGNDNSWLFRRNEEKALKLYAEKRKLTISRCGLVINTTLPIFSFSPDGIIVSSSAPDRLLEVKCPTSGQDLSCQVLLKSLDYIREDSNGKPFLKEAHAFYGQIQFSLYLGEMQDADLIIYCERDNDIIIPVTLDPHYASKMLFTLRNTYFTQILPYLFVSRDRLRKQIM